ncbi:hypothetical protein WISP_73207 [Willisornis vidua]|uniref:Uncharacterized protein n=1 Tax=Willisornis vidua TaxID=1566151 RepID=A0ABQ9DCT6_9PASS|nr:hypothetical protein WISP_73207 [Willisornis vidua]
MVTWALPRSRWRGRRSPSSAPRREESALTGRIIPVVPGESLFLRISSTVWIITTQDPHVTTAPMENVHKRFTGRLQGITMAELNILQASDPHGATSSEQCSHLVWEGQNYLLQKMLSALITEQQHQIMECESEATMEWSWVQEEKEEEDELMISSLIAYLEEQVGVFVTEVSKFVWFLD